MASNNPTRGGEEHRTIDNQSSHALRNRSRDGSAVSLERSKSPQFSQASNIIRRKYSQLRTDRAEAHQQPPHPTGLPS